MLLVLVFGSFGVVYIFLCVRVRMGRHTHTRTHTHTSASQIHTPLSHPHTFLLHTHTSLCRTHAHISTPRTHISLSHVLHVVMGVGGESEGVRVCARSVPFSPDIAPCSNGHTGQRGFFGLLDRNTAQALRQHKARRFIFYSDRSAGVLFEARF